MHSKHFTRNLFLFVFFLHTFLFAQENYEVKIEELLSKMTLEEKVGQLVQVVGFNVDREKFIRDSKVGSILIGILGAEEQTGFKKLLLKKQD